MLKKEREQRQAIEMLCTDMLVPKEHLLRKIDAAVDFARIYELVEDLYCEDNGRPSSDPVVLFKLVLIQHLFGIRSLRQTMRDAEVNVAYRWFLGYTMSQKLPHFATISYAFRHRFTGEVIEGVFRWILEEVAHAGYLSPEVVFVDGTHIKANANLKKQVKKAIPVAAKRYQEQLDEEIEADRAAHGKKPLKKDEKKDDDGEDRPSAPGKEKTVVGSSTDPESGLFHKGEHRKCFAYEAHTVCDRRGYVLETEITPGNVHDSVAFDTVFERLRIHYPEVQVITADAGYKTPWICKQIFDSGRIASLPYKRPMTKKGNLPWYEYVYDEYYDCVLCPQDKILRYATTNREGYREYKSKGYECQECPVRERCTQNQQHTKTVTRHIWQEYLERAEDIRHSPLGKATYALRSQTIERVFADAKEKHAMRYTPYRGLTAVTAWVKLKFAAMNLKKLALHKWRPFLFFHLFSILSPSFLYLVCQRSPFAFSQRGFFDRLRLCHWQSRLAASNTQTEGCPMIYVGIDVSKDKHDCYIVNSDGKVLADVFTVENNLEGFDLLFQRLKSVARDLDNVKVGLEATGHYSYNILGFLLGKGLATFVLNPLHTNLFRKSTSLRRTKTDRVDARTMAPRSNPQDSTVGGRAATWKPLGFPTLQL